MSTPKQHLETIDVTPTWESIIPIHLEAYRESSLESSKAEIMRAAKLADELNKFIKFCSKHPLHQLTKKDWDQIYSIIILKLGHFHPLVLAIKYTIDNGL